MITQYHGALKQELTEQLNQSTSALNQVFSYTLTHDFASLVLGLTLRQEETGYTLSTTMHRDALGLRVYQFTLQKDDRLAEYCAPLYDAALIDLVLQSLNLLFHCAAYWEQPQIICVFPHDEAEHTAYFDRFFDDLTYDTDLFRVRIPASEQDYHTFCARSHEIQLQVYQTLWQLQKTDGYLRRFLQTPAVRQSLQRQAMPPSQAFDVRGANRGVVLPFSRSASQK